MANAFSAIRAQLVFLLSLPVAVLVGYLLTDPTDRESLAVVALVVGLLCVPILMRWYHPLLVLSWNATINPYFLPGRPYLWMLMALAGLLFAVANRTVDPDRRFIQIPSLRNPLLLLLAVTVGTALATGGFGIRAFGSGTYGGKGYYYIIAAIAGYFALSSLRIPPPRARLYVGLFFLSSLTSLVANLAYAAGPQFQFLFYLFPPEFAMEQARGDVSLGEGVFRIAGLSMASLGLYIWILSRYGIRGVLDLSHPGRFFLFLLPWVGCLLCGFRSVLILFLMVFAMQFYLEGLHRTRLLPGILGVLVLAATLILPQTDKLPLAAQRTLCFIPGVKVDLVAAESANSSLQWRLDMWKLLLPEVPKYLLKGKGYGIDRNEMELSISTQRQHFNSLDHYMFSGDYHNGPLSLVIPFGIWGVITFGWFAVAALKYLYSNYRFGNPALKGINTLLLSLFTVKLLFFIFFFGGFYGDLFFFTGLAGLSASLNGPDPLAATAPEEEQAATMGWQAAME